MPAHAAPNRTNLPPLVEFRNVSVIRGDKRVLDSVTLAIGEGENVAIIGPNGAGKSSLIKTITREYYPFLSESPVTFRFHGKEDWDIFDFRSFVGIVSNDLQYTFTRGITGREMILSGFFSSVGLFNRRLPRRWKKRPLISSGSFVSNG